MTSCDGAGIEFSRVSQLAEGPPEPTNSAAATILVVEDNPLNAELVTDLLELSGFRVRAVDTAERALEIVRQLSPALILMDMNLPGMDGAQATQILKADSATRHIAVIGLTGDPMANCGFDGCLAKPIDVRTFVDVIKSFLPVPAAND